MYRLPDSWRADLGQLICSLWSYVFIFSFYVYPCLEIHRHKQAGGVAGTSVDILFYPLDTIKTRLQSAQGFFNAGGLRGIYNGIGRVVIGSAPGGTILQMLLVTL